MASCCEGGAEVVEGWRARGEVRRAVRHVLRQIRGDRRAAGGEALVAVACSGGPDSVALAAALAHEAPKAGVRPAALVVDHGLQPGSATRAAVAADQCRRLGLDPVEVLTVEVNGSGGPEAAARHARYEALEQASTRLRAKAVLLGHTRDDQAETVLLGLARGSGARSLSGMPPVRGIFHRPLLGLSRATVRAAVTADGLEAWDDPHNADPAFTRARVRHDALPALEKALGPGVTDALARTADLLRQDADALDRLAQEALDRATSDRHQLDVEVLTGLHPAVRTRVLRRAAIAAGSPATDLTADHVAGLDGLITDWHGQGPLHLPGRVEAARACGTLSLTTPD